MKSAPRPGRPVRGSRTGRPIMALLDLLGRPIPDTMQGRSLLQRR